MVQIKQEFESQYGKTLEAMIQVRSCQLRACNECCVNLHFQVDPDSQSTPSRVDLIKPVSRFHKYVTDICTCIHPSTKKFPISVKFDL